MIEPVITRIGKACGWLLFALVVVQFGVVLARYVLNINYLWAQEAALYLHGAIFMLASGWTLLSDRHVRIDVFSNRFSKNKQDLVEKFGSVFLLFSMMAAIVITSIGYVGESWSILEGSPEISGLPGRFLLKSLIPVFAVLLVLAAVSRLSRRSE